MPAPIEKALNAAFSRGPGYEPTPIGRSFDDNSIRGYYIDFTAKTTLNISPVPEGLPAQLIQLALGWWERHASGDPAAMQQFMGLCAEIERRGVADGDALRWPIQVDVPKYRLAAGWSSALVQGQAASVFVRAHLATGEERFAELAVAAVQPFLKPGAADIVTQTPSGPVLEEAPTHPPSHILNGWMSALWGLWDVQLALDHDAARITFAASEACLRRMLPVYDTGWWTLYALFPHPLKDLAKPIYHRFHVTQLEVYYRLTGHREFAEAAARWDRYDRPANRLLAVTHKAAFSIMDGRRRSRWRHQNAR